MNSINKKGTKKENGKIHEFNIDVPEKKLTDLHLRLANSRWPDKELVSDRSQGVQLKTMKKLVDYWQNEYDWRKVENKLNSLPQFMTEIDGLNIHFIHVR